MMPEQTRLSCPTLLVKAEMGDGLGNVAEALTLNSWLADAIRELISFTKIMALRN